jgi:hypothetical protein
MIENTKLITIELTEQQLKFLTLFLQGFEDMKQEYFEEDFLDEGCELSFDECVDTVNIFSEKLKELQ